MNMSEVKRILLVEDSKQDVELTLSALQECRLANEVVVARDGAEALDYLHRRGKFSNRGEAEPGVVFLDLKLPKVGGLEVLRQMKTDERFKNVPVVILTSSREEQDLAQSYQLGGNAYVVKPIDFQQFTATIKELGLFWAIINEAPRSSRVAGK